MSHAQGATVQSAADRMRSTGWDVAYVCIPNRPYVGVVAIPTIGGTGRQRYPDIVAGRGDVVALVEVEPRLTLDVAHQLARRLLEQRVALLQPGTYSQWRSTVRRRTGVVLPADPRIDLFLVIGQKLAHRHADSLAQLTASGIVATDLEGFVDAVAD